MIAPARVVVETTGGIVISGIVDTRHHRWQMALRGFGADWALARHFELYYVRWGKILRPEDMYAGNLLAGFSGKTGSSRPASLRCR